MNEISYTEFLELLIQVSDGMRTDYGILDTDTAMARDWMTMVLDYMEFVESQPDTKDIFVRFKHSDQTLELEVNPSCEPEDLKTFINCISSSKNVLSLAIAKAGADERVRDVIVKSIRGVVEDESVVKPSEVMINGGQR